MLCECVCGGVGVMVCVDELSGGCDDESKQIGDAD